MTHYANDRERWTGERKEIQNREHGVYYGREVMERILETIDIKRALHQRFFPPLRAAGRYGRDNSA